MAEAATTRKETEEEQLSVSKTSSKMGKEQEELKNMTMSMSVSDLENKHYNTNNKTLEYNQDDAAEPPNNHETTNNAWNECTQQMRKGIQVVVVALSVHAAKHPYWYIFGTVIVSLALAVAGAMTNLAVNVDPDVLFTPRNTITSQHYEWLVNFNPNRARRRRRQRELMSSSSPHYDFPKLSSSRPHDGPLMIPEKEDEAADFYDYYDRTDYEDLLMNHQEQMMMANRYNGWPFLLLDSMKEQHQHQPSQQAKKKRRRTQSSSGTTTVLLHANGENVVSIEGIRNLFSAYETVNNQFPWCRRRHRRCFAISALDLWDYNRTYFEETTQSDADVRAMLSKTNFDDGTPIDLRSLAGKALVYPNGTVYYAESYIILMLVREYYSRNIFTRNFGPKDPEDYGKQAIEQIAELNQEWAAGSSNSSLYKVEYFTIRAFEDELFRGIASDVPLLPIVIIIMIVFTCFAFFKCDRVKSKCLLGLGSVITIVLSILSGYGIMFCFGVAFTPMTTILPFVVIGIGLDDTFIIALAFNRTDDTKDPVKRIEETMMEVGSSITVTTMTTTLAFLLGLMSSIPSIYWLAMYAWVTIAIDFIYQITFFVALLVLDARRIQANRSDCCTCITVRRSSEGQDDDDDNCGPSSSLPPLPLPTAETQDDEEETEMAKQNQLAFTTPQQQEQQQPHLADRVMSWYATQLLKPATKMFVIVIFMVYFAICIYCTTQMEQQFRISDLTPNESFIRTFFRSMQDYTTRSTAVFVYFRNVDQSDAKIRQDMRNYIDDLVDIPAFGEQPQLCWVKDFEAYADIYPMNDTLTFEEQIDQLLDIPLIKELYRRTIYRDRNGTIKMSRCRLWFSQLDLYDVQNQLETFRAQRELSIEYANGDEEYPYFTFDQLYYLWEFYNVIIRELTLTAVSAMIAVSVVTLLVLPHWSAILFVFPMILILYIDLIGTLQFVGVRINAVSYIALVISIGVMVDFILHILIKYYESKYAGREEKVKDSLQTMGASILLGGLSTFIATIPVLFASSLLFKDIFDSFFALVTLSICHGLIFLPVVLSMIGPEGVIVSTNNEDYVRCTGDDDEDEKEEDAENVANKQLIESAEQEESAPAPAPAPAAVVAETVASAGAVPEAAPVKPREPDDIPASTESSSQPLESSASPKDSEALDAQTAPPTVIPPAVQESSAQTLAPSSPKPQEETLTPAAVAQALAQALATPPGASAASETPVSTPLRSLSAQVVLPDLLEESPLRSSAKA